MKKLLVVILSLVLILALTACNDGTKNTVLNANDISQATSTTDGVSEENKSDNVNNDFTLDSTQPDNTNNDNNTNQSTQNNSTQSTPEMSSKDTVRDNSTNQTTQDSVFNTNTETSSTQTVTDNNVNQSTQDNAIQSDTEAPSKDNETDNSKISENVDNGVLEKATAQTMTVPENIKLLNTNNADEENNSKNINATVVLYKLDGDVVNWKSENDLIYVITSGNNRLVVIDSKTMTAVSNVPLAGKPAEINLIDQEIYISLPDLCRIDIFSKVDFAKISSLYFDHEVSSFCIDDNYIYYSEHDQHCEVFKKDMTTNELTKILPDRGWSFYKPKLHLNKQDNILYVGESGSTGSTLFYFDTTTLQLKSMFKKNNYGIMNNTRDIFHVGNEIFWGNYRFSDTDARQIIGRYGESSHGSVTFASGELVSTFEGIFLTDTYECIVNYYDAGFNFEYVLVTESYNVFFRSRSVDKNVIVGVNFSMQ